MATTYTLTGQVTDALDSSPEALTRLSGYAEASQALINDTGTNTQRVGRVPLSFDSDGNFTVALVGTGSLVAGWRVVLNWRDSTFRSQEQRYSTGYFTMTANKTFAAAIVDGGSGSVIPITPTLDVAVAALVPSGSGATSAALGASYIATSKGKVSTTTLVGTSIDATGAVDSTTAILAAFAAVPAGGSIYVPPGIYQINDTIVCSSDITIEGAGVQENYTTGSSFDVPGGTPPLRGSIFLMSTASKDAFRFNGASRSPSIRGIGVQFATGLASTGHGFRAEPTTNTNAGILSFQWANLAVYGHDASHYAYYWVNPCHGVTINLRSYGGGGFYTACTSTGGNYGNLTHTGPTAMVTASGAAGGFVHASATSSGGAGLLNLITYVRPQCNMLSGNAAQPHWKDDAGAGVPADIVAINPDLEGSGTSTILNGTQFIGGHQYVAAGGGASNAIYGYATKPNPPGGNNAVFGAGAGAALTTSNSNTAVGQGALATLANGGSNNTAVGQGALAANNNASNTAVGQGALGTTTGWRNTAVGFGAKPATAGRDYTTALGYQTNPDASGAVAIGVDNAGTSASTTTANTIALGTALHQVQLKNSTTGSGSAALGSNCPAITATAPYTWFKMMSSDGSAVYVPAWK